MLKNTKIVFLDFLEFKALRAQKNYIKFHIYVRATCGREEERKSIFRLLPPNSNFTWFLVTFALLKSALDTLSCERCFS